MAVKDFWKKHNSRVVVLFTTSQVVLVVVTVATLWYTGVFQNDPLAPLLIIGGIFILNIVLTSLIYSTAIRPLHMILSTITHISGELSDTTPPQPHDKNIERDGLSEVLQSLYKLAAEQPDTDQPADEHNQQTSAAQAKSAIETALNNTVCGFVAMSPDRKITYANRATPIKIDSDGVMSLDLIFNNTEDDLFAWWDKCSESEVKAERTWARIANRLPGQEDRRFFDILASYNKDSASEVVLTLVDRTHLYEIGEEELDFIAFAAHELRGPITVIRGYIDVLKDELGEQLTDDQRELFRRLAVSANKLSGYVNNILNTSRYDRRYLRMHLTETTVADVYNSIRDDMALRASSQNRLLSINIPADLPTIAADTASLGEVFSNLIDNAIKYSNEGGLINVSAKLNGDLIDIAIQDHGIGMPGNVVGNLFQKFYRSHRSRETVAGTGIGLYISKGIVESHGGTISVQSEEGRGSTFIVSLPTYRSIADKLKNNDNDNQSLLKNTEEGVWIKNHSVFRG